MPIIHNADVYNYYLSTYAPSAGTSKYDSHKSSELKNVYSRIVKSSQDSPLYKIKMGSDVTKFAIDLKEGARFMQNVVSSLQSESEDMASLFHKKIAMSSNDAAVEVEYIGNEAVPSTPSFKMGVKSLAKPQVNHGKFLPPNGHNFEEGSYEFDLDSGSNSFEFQFNVGDGDTNEDVQQKIARLINTSDVGLSAQVVSNERGNGSALVITSKNTGLAEGEEQLFDIHSDSSYNEISLLGIDQITSPAENSSFTLNGQEHSSLSNNFTINQSFEVNLKAPTPENEPVDIGFKTNTDAVADSVDSLVKAYNKFIEIGSKYSQGHSSNLLKMDMNRLYRSMSGDLEGVGVERAEDGTLTLDRDKIASAVTGEKARDSFNVLNRFKNALSRQADQTAIDPLNYADKITVQYKNPGKTYPAPYATSRYSGLLVDQSL